MNKIKIILLTVISLCVMFYCSETVKASETLTLYEECKYTKTYGTSKTSTITIGFTELKAAGGGHFPVKIKKSGKFYNFDDFDRFLDSAFFGYNVIETENSNNTFVTAMTANKGNCPSYMTVENVNGKKDEFKALFYNDLSQSTNCKNNSTKCKAYFKLSSTVKNIQVYPAEDLWTLHKKADTKDKYCSDLTIDLTIKSNKIHAFPIYGPNTKLTESINWTQSQAVKYIWFNEDVYPLATSNKLGSLAFNPIVGKKNDDTGIKTKNDDYEADYECKLDSPQFTKKKVCKTASDLASVYTNLETSFSNLYPNISQVYATMVGNNYDPITGKVVTKALTFDDVTDVEYLKNIITKAQSGIKEVSTENAQIIINELNSIVKNTHSSLGGKNACSDAVIKAEELLEKFKKTTQEYQDKSVLVLEAVNNAEKRLVELSAEEDLISEEELKEIQENVQELETTVATNERLTERVNGSMLDNYNKKFMNSDEWEKGLETCSVLSSEMRNFLDIILWYIRIAGLVLAIILSFVDYIKAAAGSDDKSMNAANKKVLMRILFVALLFLIPALLDFVLDTLNISTTAGSMNCINKS